MGKPRFEIWISIYRSRSILDGSEVRRVGVIVDGIKNHRLTPAIRSFFSIVLNINCSFKRRRVSLEGEERFKTVFNIAVY